MSQLYFNRNTLMLHVSPSTQDQERLKEFADKNGLSAKTEFHITLINSKVGKEINKEPSSIDLVEQIADQFNWSFTEKQEHYLISKKYRAPEFLEEEDRKSLVSMVDMPDIEPFYKKLNEKLGFNLQTPFPHITLFATSTREETKMHGIAIYSKEDFEKLSPEKIEVKEKPTS